MTVIDVLRTARDRVTSSGGTGSAGPTPLRQGAEGAMVAAASWVAMLVLVVLGWTAATGSSVGFGRVLAVGSDLWLLGHGARLAHGDGVIAFTPLLLWVGLVAAGAVACERVLARVDPDGPSWDRLDRAGLLVVARFLGGYAAVLLTAWLVSFAAPVRPAIGASLPVLLVTLACMGAVALVRGRGLWSGPQARIPRVVRKAFGAAVAGTLAALGVGMLVVVTSLLLYGDRVGHVQDQLGVGLVGGTLLWLAQILALPNLALWADSFLAGPGFHVVAGAQVTWTSAESGLLPLIPVLGALPAPGPLPALTPIVVLVPLLVGAYIGRRSLRATARLASLRTKLGVAATAALLAALMLGALDGIGGGSWGAFRLADVGARAWLLVPVLAAQFAIGSLAVVLWDTRRLRRR